jgi:uncharacterized HAD superfamily protein
MIIGIDIDGVIADFVNPMNYYYNNRFKTNFKEGDYNKYRFWTIWETSQEEGINIVEDFFFSKDFEKVQPYQDTFQAIKILSEKHTLYVISSRPEMVQEKTIKWLRSIFGDMIKDIKFAVKWLKETEGISKGDICKELNVNIMIEDHFEEAEEISSQGIKTLLMSRPWNENESISGKNIIRVNGWNDILEVINKI